MADHLDGQRPHGTELPRIPFHLHQHSRRSSLKGIDVDERQSWKHRPESLHFSPANFHLRSRAESTRSSISSAHFPDSVTTCSVSTLASPLSSSYSSEIQERFAAYSINGRTPSDRVRHRHQPSNATTCSTFINDDNEMSIDSTMARIRKDRDVIRLHDDEMSDTPSVSNVSQKSFVKKAASLSSEDSLEWPRGQRQRQRDSIMTVTKSDTTSVISDDLSHDDADIILDYTLQTAFGVGLDETTTPAEVFRAILNKCIGELGQYVWEAPSEGHATQTGLSSSSSASIQAGSSGVSNIYGKRKKQAGGEEGGDEFSDGDGSGFGSAKRAKPSPREEETLRLSCPFRRRNPRRFNVRDHHSCAMTYFPKFAELRQHIVKQHKRDDPSAFVCDRCTRDFRTRKELRDHQRQPKERMCDISDHDPEAGIDGPTAIKLVSRKRASGTSADVQWREIWNILFPDDEDQMIQPYCYTPVIEHFELSAQYIESFESLQSSLHSKMANPTTLETLATKFHQCFVEAMESCATVARTMPYTNRSNKKNEPTRVQSLNGPNPRRPWAMTSRPDSGVVLDDGSEESGSVLGLAALGHRDSVRTVKDLAPRPRSCLASRSAEPRAVMPVPTAPPVVAGPLIRPLSALPPGMATSGVDSVAAVRAWNNSVTYDQDAADFGLPPDQWVAEGGLPPHTGFVMDDPLFYKTDFSTMGDGFSGFDDR